MNKKRFSLMAIALFAMLCIPFSAFAQSVKLAEWTFETGYETTQVDNKTYYKPSETAAADIAVTWFKDGAPYIYPNEYAGEQSDYVMSAMSESRYWQVCTGWEVKVLRIENTTANAITDYTDGSKHNVYYEVSFPTKGYKNISIDYAMAPGNNTETPVEAVVSTDGGKTWFDAGSTKTSTAWFVYTKTSFNLSVNNKDNVIVRLIITEGATNWNLDYLTINGEKQEEAKPIEAIDATMYWEFASSTNNVSAAEVSVPEAVSATSYTLGTNLYFNSTQNCTSTTTGEKETLSKLNPYVGIGRAQEDNSFVQFSIIPKKGMNFTPKKLNFNACKCGTSGGTLYIYAISGDKKITVAEAFDPVRNNDFSAAEYDLSALGTVNERVDIFFYIWNLADNKQLAMNKIKVTGDFNGTPEAVPVYTMSAKCGTEGAGNVSVNPAGAEFDEGTELTVTATENFGYHFSAWVDAEGNTVSTENPYVFEINANTNIKAIYTQKNVYALNYSVTGGANDYLVQFTPTGNIVDGVHYYEEGTEVKVSALNNTILTFTNWEDNTTEQERIIKMDGEKTIKANYSCEDYIVAWDFYMKNPTSQRAADYKSDSENAGQLVLRKEDGTTNGWLGAGTDSGSPYLDGNARPWKDLSEKYYFEISFATKGYTDIKIANRIGKDYNSYSVFNVEYSIDGTSYTKFGQVDIPETGWVENTFNLPKEAENQAKIWVRWMPDFSSAITGSSSNLDGIKWGATFVLASINAADDPNAPKLVNAIPANGATGVSANGSIVLTFDEKVYAVDGAKATLAGETLTPTISGKTLIYPYARLEYDTEYTFSLPAGAITDRTGNKFEGAEIKFTTMSRKQPEARIFDAVIAQDGSGDFTTIQAAIDAAPAGRATPWLIFVKNGTYREHINVPANKPNLHFIGQEYDKVEFSDSVTCTDGRHMNDAASFVSFSNDLFFENIAFVNAYGRYNVAGPQALALNTQGDRNVFNKCSMYSYQDTWYTTATSNNRAYVKDCFIEGAVDFIYNSGNYYFDECTINIIRKDGGYIVAPSHTSDVKWGYVFMNNTITAPGVPSETSVWLGRPWHNNPKTVWINTIAEVTIPAAGWYEKMGGLPALWAEYNTMDGKGNPVDLSERRTKYWKEGENGEKIWGESETAVLTAEQAAQYTIENVLGGDDNWQPEVMCEACAAPVATITGTTMKWDAVPYSICYVITKNGKVVGFTTETSYTIDDANAEYHVQAANEFGGLSEASKANTETGIENVSNAETATVQAIYSIDGKMMNNLRNGQVNIVKYSDGTIKKVVK